MCLVIRDQHEDIEEWIQHHLRWVLWMSGRVSARALIPDNGSLIWACLHVATLGMPEDVARWRVKQNLSLSAWEFLTVAPRALALVASCMLLEAVK
jgi:hypothetical protein